MDEDTITIKALLEWMDSGRPFDLTYVTADSKRGTGGQLVTQRSCVKTGLGAAGPKAKRVVSPSPEQTRNPNHSVHFTRNILLPRSKGQHAEVRKVHVLLITRFNGKKVL